MELRQLESFREVVRRGSFTAAARALHMTQPAVSLHVKTLEQHLGSRLLERDTRGVRLTRTGEVLLGAVDAVFAALDDARRRIAEIENPEHGMVALACGDTVALHLLPPVLRAFRERHPRAEVRVHNHGSRAILEMLLRREADLGVVTRPPWIDPALSARTVHVERFVVALPPGHPRAREREIDPASLDGEPAVLLAKPAETRLVIDRALGNAGAHLQVVMESGNLEVVKAYVAGGLGLSVLPELAIAPADRERLALVDLPETFPQRRLALVQRADATPGVLARSMLRLLAGHLKAE